VSISTEINLLITNMIIFSRLDASFSVKRGKKSKLKKCQLTEYIDIALSDLVFSSLVMPRHTTVSVVSTRGTRKIVLCPRYASNRNMSPALANAQVVTLCRALDTQSRPLWGIITSPRDMLGPQNYTKSMKDFLLIFNDKFRD